MQITAVFSIIILILSIMFHELAHGTVADRLGDPTPRLMGRLTLNPFAHLEWFGSFVVPLLCIVSGTGFIIGWAKPVPFNLAQIKNKRWGPAMIAVAGPIINIMIALLCALVFRIVYVAGANESFVTLLAQVVIINISLAVFNLIPIPPLDGHHILGSIIPSFKHWSDRVMHRYGIVLLIVVLFFAGSIITPLVMFFSQFLLS